MARRFVHFGVPYFALQSTVKTQKTVLSAANPNFKKIDLTLLKVAILV
jgi:hypothetical protein